MQVGGVERIGISLVADQRGNDGAWNLRGMPSACIKSQRGNLLARRLHFAGRMNLPIFMEINARSGFFRPLRRGTLKHHEEKCRRHGKPCPPSRTKHKSPLAKRSTTKLNTLSV